jgi:hypothetical protein
MELTILTAVIAIFTALVWRVYSRMRFMMGAQRSHTARLVQLEARRDGIKLVWRDAMVEPPPSTALHRHDMRFETIYFMIPEDQRQSRSYWQSIKHFWPADLGCGQNSPQPAPRRRHREGAQLTAGLRGTFIAEVHRSRRDRPRPRVRDLH